MHTYIKALQPNCGTNTIPMLKVRVVHAITNKAQIPMNTLLGESAVVQLGILPASSFLNLLIIYYICPCKFH